MDCERCRDIIASHLEGEAAEAELSAVREHVDHCLACRLEFEALEQVEAALGAALQPRRSGGEVRPLVLDRLRDVEAAPAGRGLRLVPVAAALLVGIFLGGAAAGLLLKPTRSADQTVQPPSPLAAATLVRVTAVTGTALVKHRGAEGWDALGPGSVVRVGDSFLCVGRSTADLRLADAWEVQLRTGAAAELESWGEGVTFALDYGELDVKLQKLHPGFQVRTPDGVVEATGTEFTVTVR